MKMIPPLLFAVNFGALLLFYCLIAGCGGSGGGDSTDNHSSNSSSSVSIPECYFIQDSEGNYVNVGEVGTPAAEQVADNASRVKSNIVINNCGGTVAGVNASESTTNNTDSGNTDSQNSTDTDSQNTTNTGTPTQ